MIRGYLRISLAKRCLAQPDLHYVPPSTSGPSADYYSEATRRTQKSLLKPGRDTLATIGLSTSSQEKGIPQSGKGFDRSKAYTNALTAVYSGSLATD